MAPAPGIPTVPVGKAAWSHGRRGAIVNPKSIIQNSPLKTRHSLAALILLMFISLAVIYSVVTPPFEAGDESRHYAVVKYIADTGRLPVQEPGEPQIHWSHEGNQPPLYYTLAAALTFWIDDGDWDDVYWYNPHTTIGNPLREDNKNIVIHPPGEAWPWRGHVLAVHLARFLSIAMAAGTVAATYAIALHLFRGRRWPAAGAVAITAFNPMFIFISASVNNDNAVILFCTLTLWLLVRLVDPPAAGRTGQRAAAGRTAGLVLGLLIGLGALSKLYAFGLLPLAAAVLVWLAWQSNGRGLSARFWRRAAGWNGAMLAVFLLTAGWFYARNALLYHGDIFALQVMRETAGMRQHAPTLATLRAEFQGFRIAYWALFGGVNILADGWIYSVLDAVSLLAVLGVVGFLILDFRLTIRRPASILQSSIQNRLSKISRPTFSILLGWYLIMVSGFIAWNITQPAGQGRLLYPATAAISALGMLGLTWFLPRQGQKLVAGLCAAGLFVFAAVSPFRYIAPAYAAPPLLTPADLPPDIQPVDFTYDGTMRLIGYRLGAEVVRPAQTLPITLYWELHQPARLDYSIFIHLLGRGRGVVGQIDSYPGGGKWPTTLLQPGQIIADRYAVPIRPEAELDHAPARLLIAAGIYDYREPGRPGKPAVDAAGRPVEPVIAAVKLVPWQWPNPPRHEPVINFFDKARLLSYELSPDALTLNWEATGTFDTDYTVFIQLWRVDTNEYAAGFDGPPVQGDYPTSLWSPGEIIVDVHPLDLSNLPAGTYRLLVGLYNPATGERLPAFGPDGPLPDYAVELGVVER
ncbi:MAG: phospholipid carrier-dependent glycosyltransferase [Chloroflexi bacterium]|nr:MAG: phospholipid carrier-dependent glycosyltransferase [Chloroflexota bacterium]